MAKNGFVSCEELDEALDKVSGSGISSMGLNDSNILTITTTTGEKVTADLSSLASEVDADDIKKLNKQIEGQGKKIEAQGKEIEAQGKKIEAQGKKVDDLTKTVTAQGKSIKELADKLAAFDRAVVNPWGKPSVSVVTD